MYQPAQNVNTIILYILYVEIIDQFATLRRMRFTPIKEEEEYSTTLSMRTRNGQIEYLMDGAPLSKADYDTCVANMQKPFLPALPVEIEKGDSRELKKLETMAVDIVNNATPDVLSEFRNRLAFLKEKVADVTRIANTAMIERIQETKEDITLPGGIRLYVGEPPSYKAINASNLLTAILMLCGGDPEESSRCLASGWFKKSEVQTRCDAADPLLVSDIRKNCGLDDRPDSPCLFDQLIVTIKEPELKEGAEKKLPKLSVDSGYRATRKPSAKNAKPPAVPAGSN